MSQTFTANGIDLGTTAVRAGSIQGFVTQAELGGVGISSVIVDNPVGTVSIPGLKTFTVDESTETAGDQRIYVGRIAERTYRRGTARDSSLRTGAASEIAVSLSDLNVVLGDRIITGTDGKRPSETVTARTAWILASDYLVGLVADNGFVNTNSTVLDATDYTGQKPVDVLADMALRVGWNFFVYWDEAASERALWFQNSNTSGDWDSGCFLSNVLGDIDQAATLAGTADTWWVKDDAFLISNPARVYSGAYLPYAKGFVYVEDANIESNFVARDGSAPNANVRTSATATAIATAFLEDNSTEDDRITCTFQPAASQINAIKAGQLVQGKFTHFPGYETYSYFRVMKRTVAQIEVSDQHYQVTVELSPAAPSTPQEAFAELQFQSGSANGHASPYGPLNYEIVHSRTGDSPDGGWPNNAKYGPISYLPVYTDAGAPLGEYYRGLTVGGAGTIDVEWHFDASWIATENYTWEMQVRNNGGTVSTLGGSGTNGFVSFHQTLTDTITVASGDVLTVFFTQSSTGAGTITIGPGISTQQHFRISGTLTP